MIEGEDPEAVVHLPRLRLFDSPVVPAFARQVGALVVPSLTARLTVSETPLLKTASEPPALPTTLNSDCFHHVPR